MRQIPSFLRTGVTKASEESIQAARTPLERQNRRERTAMVTAAAKTKKCEVSRRNHRMAGQTDGSPTALFAPIFVGINGGPRSTFWPKELPWNKTTTLQREGTATESVVEPQIWRLRQRRRRSQTSSPRPCTRDPTPPTRRSTAVAPTYSPSMASRCLEGTASRYRAM